MNISSIYLPGLTYIIANTHISTFKRQYLCQLFRLF